MTTAATVGFDTLHVILITGFVSFMSAVAAHVLTKWQISKRFVTLETHAASIVAIFKQCELNRERCALIEIREDIADIKRIQNRRTDDLKLRQEHEDRIWRVVFDALKIPVREQNSLLSACVYPPHPNDEAA